MRDDLLEFSVFKEHVAPLLVSELGRLALHDLGPLPGWEAIRERWRLLGEVMELMQRGEMPTVPAVPDVRVLLRLREGAVIEGPDLLAVADAVYSLSRLKQSLEHAGVLTPLALKMSDLGYLASEIESSLLPTGEVSERANPLLRDLRARQRSVRARILERMEDLLQEHAPCVMEDLITTRNDRYVLPMRHDFGTRLQGITHDYSRSRQTVYVEPMELVDENNLINRLRADIREEEFRIFRELSELVFQEAPTIARDLEVYATIDLIHAGALWARKYHAVIPRVAEGGFTLKNARHPVLLERLGREHTVPVDLLLPDDRRCLIISGPNAGGKTVALKTLGLLLTMARCGLAIPADEAIIPAVGNILVEMDTSQDIEHDLSSFTAHAMKMKEICAAARPGDLVLLDEPGTGTDHDQGGAFAVACIDALMKRGSFVVATSHSDLVKLYAMSHEQHVQTAATAYDEDGLRPLYSLVYGSIGGSRAFEILDTIEFPREIVDEARGIVERDGNVELVRAMEDLSRAHRLKLEAEREHAEALRLREAALREAEECRRERTEAALDYRRLMSRLERSVRRPQTPEKLRKLREAPEARKLEQALTEQPAALVEVQPGSVVRLRGGGMEGEVKSVSGDTVEVVLGGKRLQVGRDQLEAGTPREKKRRPQNASRHVGAGPSVLPVVVVGMRVDDAMPVVERAVDRAMLSGQETLEIVHGAGSGRLRAAVREYLRRAGGIKRFEDGEPGAGGDTKTIIYLRN